MAVTIAITKIVRREACTGFTFAHFEKEAEWSGTTEVHWITFIGEPEMACRNGYSMNTRRAARG
jgi:hypothetical protein